MKKALSIVLAVVMVTSMMLAMTGCNRNTGFQITPTSPVPAVPSQPQNSISDNTQAAQPTTPAPTAPPAAGSSGPATTLALNTPVTVGNTMEITILSSEWAESILPSNTQGVYSYIKDNEGEKYFVVKAKIKNLCGEDIDVSFHGLDASLLINGTYKADVQIDAEELDGTGFYGDIKPLQTLNVIFYASVSDELQSICENAELTILAANDATYISEFFDEDVPHNTYKIKFTK